MTAESDDRGVPMTAAGEVTVTTPPEDRRRGWLRPARWLAVAGVVILFGWLVARQWDQLTAQAAEVSVGGLALSLVFAMAATTASMMSWRVLLTDLGSTLPVRGAARVFFIGALGKYVPGSVWNVVAQMELARAYRVPRIRSATASVVLYPVALTTAALVSFLTLPFGEVGSRRYGWLALVPPVGLVLLHPKVLGRLLGTLLRLVRRPALERLPSLGGVSRSAAWMAVAFAAFGLHVWLLGRDVGAEHGPRLLLVATGAFAAAWAIGFLVVVVPGGAGVREAALIFLLSPVLTPAEATVVALASRVVVTAADALAAGLAAALVRPALPEAQA